DVGGTVDPRHRLLEAERAAGIGAGDDDEVGIELVALADRKLNLLNELLDRNAVHDIFVIVRALGIELIFDVDTGDAGADELSHRAHGVQAPADAGPGLAPPRDLVAARPISAQPPLLGHR